MTNEDRKMIELAATAAGYEIARWTDNGDALLLFGVQEPWNPLADNGDALRLAVKLCLSLSTGPCVVKCNSISGALRGSFIEEDSIYQDHYAATRRAIVRAAAEIGRAAIAKKEPQ
jgi:hypothetical protein